MPKIAEDKNMKTINWELLYSKKLMTCKWIDNRSVPLLSVRFEGINDLFSFKRREKESVTLQIWLARDGWSRSNGPKNN